MALQQSLPSTHRALVLTSINEPPAVKVLPTPQPGPGSAVVRILAAGVISYMRDIYDGARNYRFPTPLVIGSSAVGRIAAVGPDATVLKPGQLVHIDSTIRGRDDPNSVCLAGIHEGFTDASRRLMHGEWKDWTFAGYAKVPLENCAVLNEQRLLENPEDGGLGYAIEDLVPISRLLIPYGGLRDIDIKTGETVIVAPATGPFGGCAVMVALAMGARVIAMGRNIDVLNELAKRHERVEAVPMTGDMQADLEALKKFAPIDAFFDISPPAAAQSTHIKSAILALRHSGHVSLMGGIHGDVAIPYFDVMHRDLQLKGKWMYDRSAVQELVRMVEMGALKLGEAGGLKVGEKFGLDEYEAAFARAAENPSPWVHYAMIP